MDFLPQFQRIGTSQFRSGNIELRLITFTNNKSGIMVWQVNCLPCLYGSFMSIFSLIFSIDSFAVRVVSDGSFPLS
jgi:hypothetical protein